VLVVGGGIVGVALALALRRRHPTARITLIEKEGAFGTHASGRNSGVLHAGFYYSADSLKARLTHDGNRALTTYCLERGLPLNRCGKLVVARSAADLPGLDELERRGRANGVPLERVTADEARRIEPRARTVESALFSPTTASVNPKAVVAALVADARAAGIALVAGAAYLGRQGDTVRTAAGPIVAGYVVNAAGVYADHIAHDFGYAADYEILPFKGLYLHAAPGWTGPGFRTHVYPVPDLRQPFLGVHVTLGVDGTATIGPTATPAFWREHYHGWTNFRWRECLAIVRREAAMFLRNDGGFRTLALAEWRKVRRAALVADARALADDIAPAEFPDWGPPGIRAQLVNRRTRALEMDFRWEGDARSLHVLNAVSPAFTCALPFAAFLAERIDALRG